MLGPFDTSLDPQINREAWGVLVRATPQAVAFVGVSDVDSANIAAVRELHQGRWAAVGVGLSSDALDAAADGELVLVSGETFLQGLIAGRLQAAHLRRGTELLSGWVQVPPLVVTRRNAAEIIARQASPEKTAAWYGKHDANLINHPDRYLRPLSESAVGAAG